MVFVIAKGKLIGKVLLVKADDEDMVKELLVFDEDDEIVGCFTNAEIEVFSNSDFVVFSG
ncbi:unnamed protein product [marine sediment metagenome]|uniref:Uncharacterized protein n=1 Tax=marine sediment metagenome TaxID=412755 RepID=X1GNZ2_9ZZZZ